MAEQVLTADVGRELGSSSSRRLRREGKIPGVLYGLGADPISLAVGYSDLRHVLSTDAGLNALIKLEVDGGAHLSIVKELQRHPVRDEVIHVDFIRIDAKAELTVEVPVVLDGEARQVTSVGGMVDQVLFSLEVISSPDQIPNELVVDISDLELNGSIQVRDIPLPAGVRTEVDPDDPVALGTLTRAAMEALAESGGELGGDAEDAGSAGDDGADDAGDEAGDD